MKSRRIGIQGIRASFHDVASRQYFQGDAVEPVECRSFKELCTKLDDRQADLAMMAIENSIAGSILTNYSLLERHGFKIIGETYLRIEMCFLALKGQTAQDIRFVQSHPMAILQCEEFLAGLGDIQVLEAADTAESAKDIGAKKLKGYAAIAGRLAGETYGLHILNEGIETNKQNYTRFLAISRSQDYQTPKDANKASVRFEASDRPGSLSEILTVFKESSVNLTKIQSVPILGKPYQYGFHVDLEWEDTDLYRRAMDEILHHAVNLIHFGEYRRGEKPR